MKSSIIIAIIIVAAGVGVWWYISQPVDFGVPINDDQSGLSQTGAILNGQASDDQAADETESTLEDLSGDGTITPETAFDVSAISDEEAQVGSLDQSVTDQGTDDSAIGSTTTQLTETTN